VEIIVKGIKIQSALERAVKKITDINPSRNYTRELTVMNRMWLKLMEKRRGI
jgi:hypothetical protein